MFGYSLEDLQRQILRGLVVRVLFVFEIIPDVSCLPCVQMGVQVHVKGCALRDTLLFPDVEAIQEEQEVVQVA